MTVGTVSSNGHSVNLNQFLKAFFVNVQDMGPAGNVVSTTA